MPLIHDTFTTKYAFGEKTNIKRIFEISFRVSVNPFRTEFPHLCIHSRSLKYSFHSRKSQKVFFFYLKFNTH